MLYPHLEGRRIVLASQSPRRRELMGMLGLEVECMARDVDESWPQELEGVGVAEYVARKKAAAYLDVLGPSDVLITGDTVVVLHGKVLEKPTDEAHACEMLRALSGQTHTVASAVAVTTLEHGTQSALDVCDVDVNVLTEAFIQGLRGFRIAHGQGRRLWGPRRDGIDWCHQADGLILHRHGHAHASLARVAGRVEMNAWESVNSLKTNFFLGLNWA